MNNPLRVNYLLPILATLAATLIVIVLFAVLAISAITISLRQLTAPTDDALGAGLSGGLGGLIALVLFGAILFFFEALLKGARDLGQPLQHVSGWLGEKYIGRGGMGGNWLVLRLDEPPPAAGPSSAALREPVVAGAPAGPPPAGARSGPAAQAAPPPATGFGTGLTEVQQKTRRTTAPPAPAPAPPTVPPRRAPGTTRLFRVDKTVYNALRPGEPLTVAYSRFLEHVYYVEHQESAEPVVLYNKSLL